MANGIYAHFYTGSTRRAPGELFAKMINAMSVWEEAENAWRHLRVFDAASDGYVVDRGDALAAGELLAETRAVRNPTASIECETTFRCWHTATGEPFEGVERATIIARGDSSWGMRASERRFRGNAELAVRDRAPFTILDVNEFGPGAQNWNRHVEENLEILTAGLFRIIDAVKPASMKVYDGFGDFLPVNANMAYYRNEAEVIADLRFMAELWNDGDQAGHIPPLKHGYAGRGRSIFGSLRTDAMQQRLWSALSRGLEGVDRITEHHVRRALASSTFDYYAMPAGFTVLEHPGFMNSYLHDFYLAVLDARGED